MINQALSVLLQAGLSVIPTRDDKTPAVATWKPFQARKATAEEFLSWPPAHGLGIVCGPVSGGVFCFDVDLKNCPTGRSALEFMELVREQAPDLPERLVAEETPAGGWHFVGRCSKSIGNLKLARNKEGRAIIETRGEGGYFCAAPTPKYTLRRGSFAEIPEVTPEELDILLDCARAMSLEEQEPDLPTPYIPHSRITPFDDYDARTTPESMAALLTSHGWTKLFSRGQAVYFRRPGKQGRGISATFNHVPGRLYVFTTSTQFESEHVYKPYAVFALLEFQKDFRAAAKALAAQGYGDKREQKPALAPTPAPEPMVLEREIFHLYDHGVKKGVSPGWPALGGLYQVVKGQLNIVTGIPSHGKSEFVDALMVNLANSHGWRFVVYSPENYPVVLHARKLIEKKIGKSMFGPRRMNLEELGEGVRWVMDHFHFLDGLDESVSLDSIFQAVEEIKKTRSVDGVVIDPWNELESTRPEKMSETDFIGLCLKRARMFARKHEIAFWIVAHPYKLRKDQKTNKYPVPTMYDISGSAHWYNKADNGIVVWRDFDLKQTEILVQKIKFKYYGKTGSVCMKYDVESCRYAEMENADHFRPENIPTPRQLPPEPDEEIHF
jgi:hypothetical protein